MGCLVWAVVLMVVVVVVVPPQEASICMGLSSFPLLLSGFSFERCNPADHGVADG